MSAPVYLEVQDVHCPYCERDLPIRVTGAAQHIGEAFAALEAACDAHLAVCPKAPKEIAAHG